MPKPGDIVPRGAVQLDWEAFSDPTLPSRRRNRVGFQRAFSDFGKAASAAGKAIAKAIQPPLFGEDGRQSTFIPSPWPLWVGNGATATQKARAIKGLHPTGRRIGCHLDAGDTCGRCARSVVKRLSSGNALKCIVDQPRWTGGLNTDVRHKWWGCVRFLRNNEHNGE